MKRISIVAVLALFAAVASTGCAFLDGAGLGGGEDTDESEQASGRSTTTAEDEQNAALIRGPQQALDLNLHPNGDSQGPHPEPWLRVTGPHPEPWNGTASADADPNADPNAPNGAKKP